LIHIEDSVLTDIMATVISTQEQDGSVTVDLQGGNALSSLASDGGSSALAPPTNPSPTGLTFSLPTAGIAALPYWGSAHRGSVPGGPHRAFTHPTRRATSGVSLLTSALRLSS
jgi:hypothetical protein